MSKENVKKFYQAVTADEGLRTRLNELFKSYQGQEVDEQKKAVLVEKLVLPEAAEKGLTFTMEELRQYEKEAAQRASADHELDDSELEAVAGGSPGAGFALCFLAGVGVMVEIGVVGCYGLGIEI
jgi:hypothetical protein